MAAEVTVLRVPDDAAAHALRYGARRDSATGMWFVVGPVPGELQNYVPRPENARLYEEAPPCPECGARTHKLINSKGDLYWRCITRFKTKCPGKVDHLDYLDRFAPPQTIGDYLPKIAGSLFGPVDACPTRTRETVHPLRELWCQIELEALMLMGDDKHVMRWLEEPKNALKRGRPIRLLGTKRGCETVLRLLRDLRT